MLRREVYYFLQHRKKWVISFLLILAVIIVFSYRGFGNVNCENFSCFQKNMKYCSKASYVNEADEATWKYEILEKEGRECSISVKLLQAKKGDLEVDKLEGLGMECNYPLGVIQYPEKDLSKCHGRLKEEIQTIIIEKLHTVIIENLGTIDESLNGI